jgi:malate dehydrogenase (oxaloacetate-decarboxylating)(NADP+)
MTIKREDALFYHESGQPGKIEVVPTKMLSSQLDLALAYSPGVAEPCKEIFAKKEEVYRYTAKGNLVGVITNGTAVLGLGNIGPEASKPVMEGKGVLFKKFAGIDVFDIELNCLDPDQFIAIVQSMEPTFGGINLEDIKAPECFKIEEVLRKTMRIPVMHDDQHGTAIISGSALLNALELANKKIEDVKLVVSGAGAAAISCTRLYITLGARYENIVMCDIKGVLRKDRDDLDESQLPFATERDLHHLADAIVGADVFIGLSAGNVLKPEMLEKMAPKPIVFAMANPTPEIDYKLAVATRPDAIVATGRSDYPNQVNNVLGFPYIFRGALDVRATEINEAMKLAAVYAISNLAKQSVPEMVTKAYGEEVISFGPTYLIPKPLDPRLITTISPAVARAAMESGVAQKSILDWEAYELELQRRVGIDNRLIARAMNQARKSPKRIVFAEGDHVKVMKAAQTLLSEGIAYSILLGTEEKIRQVAEQHAIDLKGIQIIDVTKESSLRETFAQALFEKRKRKGMTLSEASRRVASRKYFGCMMLEQGQADGFIAGLTEDYPSSLLPALQVIGTKPGIERVTGVYILSNKKGTFFFADTTVNANPDAKELCEIVGLTADLVRSFDMEPRVAMLSYSNFGSGNTDSPTKMRQATRMAKQQYPETIIEGEIQANVALDILLQQEKYPFSALASEPANTFIFPNLDAGNIAYKLLQEMGGMEATGPILLGMAKPVHILQMGASVREIINMATITVLDAQNISA